MKVPGIINEISHNIAGNKNENRNESAQTMNEIDLHLYEKYRALYERETQATIDRGYFNERYGIIHNGLQALACVH